MNNLKNPLSIDLNPNFVKRKRLVNFILSIIYLKVFFGALNKMISMREVSKSQCSKKADTILGNEY